MGWVWATLPLLCSDEPNSIRRGPFGSAIKKAFFVSSGFEVYEQKNAIYGDFALGDYYIDQDKYQELRAFAVAPGDVIMSCSGTVGRLAVVPLTAQNLESSTKSLFDPADPSVVVTDFFYAFRSKLDQILLENTRGTAMKNIGSVTVLKSLLMQLPPLAEQEKIVAELKRVESIIEATEDIVQAAMERAERLRQTIFRKRFVGNCRIRSAPRSHREVKEMEIDFKLSDIENFKRLREEYEEIQAFLKLWPELKQQLILIGKRKSVEEMEAQDFTHP